MLEQTHILNRLVIFTEIPGSPKLPQGTRITSKKVNEVSPEYDVIALTPTGQRYEFRSTHIANLIKTPWVDCAPNSSTPAKAVAPPQPPPPAVEPPNPFSLGDVASVEHGIMNEELPTIDVTGSSASETFEVPAEVVTPAEVTEVIPAVLTPKETTEVAVKADGQGNKFNKKNKKG